MKLNLGCGKLSLEGFINIDFHGGDMLATADNLPFQDSSFDFVLASHVLEHVPSLVSTVKEIHRILCTGGLFEIRVPTGLKTLYDAFHLRTFNLHTMDSFCQESIYSLQFQPWFEKISATVPSFDLNFFVYHLKKYLPFSLPFLARLAKHSGLLYWEWGKPKWRVPLTPRAEILIILKKRDNHE